MLPSRQQWKQWCLPSKYTTISLVVGLISILLAVVFYIFPRQGGAELSPSLPPPIFRATPNEKLSHSEVQNIVKKYGFYAAGFSTTNGRPSDDNQGFANRFTIERNGQVVVDYASGLIWQKSNSLDVLTFNEAQDYIKSLRSSGFAGYSDWRLPTSEEALSLLEQNSATRTGAHVDTVFNVDTICIWTSDKSDETHAWIIQFAGGECFPIETDTLGCWVRAVR